MYHKPFIVLRAYTSYIDANPRGLELRWVVGDKAELVEIV